MMEGKFFFTTVAGPSMSIAGFAALIAWLRDDSRTWDPINLWRMKAIAREAFTIVFLALALMPDLLVDRRHPCHHSVWRCRHLAFDRARSIYQRAS